MAHSRVSSCSDWWAELQCGVQCTQHMPAAVHTASMASLEGAGGRCHPQENKLKWIQEKDGEKGNILENTVEGWPRYNSEKSLFILFILMQPLRCIRFWIFTIIIFCHPNKNWKWRHRCNFWCSAAVPSADIAPAAGSNGAGAEQPLFLFLPLLVHMPPPAD